MSVRELSPELKEKARRELNEVDDRIQEDINHIKEWLKEQPHLRARTDDQWILTFLRGCKFNLERTKERLDFFYTARSLLPETFTNRDPFNPEIQEILKLGVMLRLKNLKDPLAPPVIFIRNGLYDTDKIKQTDLFKVNMMMMDLDLIEDDKFLINGVEIVQDLKDMHLGHMSNPVLAKKGMTIMQDAYPIRIKGVHFFNLPSFFEKLYGIIKPLMKKKLEDRMNIYVGDHQELFEKVPQHVFPAEYGGDAGPIKDIIEQFKKRIEDHRDWFIEDSKYGCDEKKRPGKPKTIGEIFGIEGTFQNLNVD